MNTSGHIVYDLENKSLMQQSQLEFQPGTFFTVSHLIAVSGRLDFLGGGVYVQAQELL